VSDLWCGVVWCGVVWCGVVWCGVVWCGVVWCGVIAVEDDVDARGSSSVEDSEAKEKQAEEVDCKGRKGFQARESIVSGNGGAR